MKHSLRILLCIFLIAALLVGACWFFLSYRPDLTCSVLENRAAAAVSGGHYRYGVALYSYAWKLSPGDPELAVSLSDAYQHIDNYTKAEYTLVSAISAHPDSIALYEALSKVYVAQDKLLDAQQMLDRVADESVRAQLASLRPAAPVVQPDAGYYTNYVDVSLSYEGGAAYLTTNGDYPSLEKDLYTKPVSLPAGESAVEAVVVSDSGLVSPLAEAGFTIGGVIEPYTFQDAAFEACVRKTLGKGTGETIMTNELWALTKLELTEDVQSLADLAECHGLTSLSMHKTYGVDFSELSKVPTLTSLDLSGCTVSSAGLEAIGGLTGLTSLNLNGCALTDITPLSGLSALTTLDLSNNAISDISALTGLSALTNLNLSANTVASISPLAACSALETLDVSSNKIANLTALKGKTSLGALSAAGNQISDLSPLSGCTALKLLDVSTNGITDLTPVASLKTLQTLAADHNGIAALPSFAAAQSLTKISVNNNAIPDVDGLKGLPILSYVSIDYNKVASLDALKDCANLVQVDAFGNPIKSVSALTDHGVIVNYDPT